MYAADAPFPVYSQTAWWGEGWDARDFGKDMDFSRPFFEQFAAMRNAVPHLACSISNSENCLFNNFCADSKNCYMGQRLGHAEEAFYSYLVIDSRSVCDGYNIVKSELCYETLDATNCYGISYSQNVVNCSSSSFLFNCRDCKNCCLCANLRNAEYCFGNVKLSKEEYERKIADLAEGSASSVSAFEKQFTEMKRRQIVPALWGFSMENASGNYLTECKDVHDSFDCHHCRDVAFAWGHIYGEDCMDTAFNYHCDRTYDFAAGTHAQDIFFSFNILAESHDLAYCVDCVSGSHDLFGCISMKHGTYCILNKQYTKEEYQKLVPRIIEHMRKTGEWGEYFPTELSPFAYNETVAQEYFPMTKEEIDKRGWKWNDQTDELPKVSKIIPAQMLPDSINNIPDDILNWAIECEFTGRPFKIVKQELEFYRQMRLPVPHLHPDERHRRRLAMRNPRKLWSRPCVKCGAAMQTAYAPERPEIVYCERCYLKEVY